jgi:hypothetical protein
MTKSKKLLLVGLGISFAVIQCFGPTRTNPPVVESHAIQSRLQIPPRIVDTLNHACMDCHSYETRWPWYSRVAPVSWWLINNVNDGRDTLNFSEWTQYKPSFAIATLGSMATVVKRGAMPLASYKTFHPQARLSDEERKAFCDWALTEKQNEFENIILEKPKPKSP